MGGGATGAMKVGAGTEDRGGEEDALREEGGEEVDGWGLGVAAPPSAGVLTPGAGAAAGGELGAAALTVETGFVLAQVSGGSTDEAFAAE